MTSTPGAAPLRVIYVSADNCPWCQRWARDEGMEFESSPARARLSYEQVHFSAFQSYRIRDAWPAAQRPVYDQLVAQNARISSPLFVVMRGERVVTSGAGLAAWRSTILPEIDRQLSA